MSQGRHASRSARTKPIVILAVLIVLAVAGAAITMLANGKNPVAVITGGDKPIPEFAFTITKTQAVPTKDGVQPAKLAKKAQAATKTVAGLLDGFYTEAFLDPNVWGSDPIAFDAFTDDARSAATKKLRVLTAGPDAGNDLKDLQPAASTLSTRVLFDDKGDAYQVMATVAFIAEATLSSGRHATVVSTGQYFLKPVDGRWMVVAFEVKRADHETAPPSPGGTATTASPS